MFPTFPLTLQNQVLTLRLGELGTYVVNKQAPNRQIWLSSPVRYGTMIPFSIILFSPLIQCFFFFSLLRYLKAYYHLICQLYIFSIETQYYATYI